MVNTVFQKSVFLEEFIDLNEDDNIINRNIIKKERENNENNIDIKCDSITSNSKYDTDKLKKILEEKEDTKINILTLLENLQKKIILNE